MLDSLGDYFLTSLISILVIINPLSTVSVFLSMTKNLKPPARHKIAFRTSLVAFCVLIFFALTGFWVFKIYSITIDSFRIAGGIALMAIGIKMLYPAPTQDRAPPTGEMYIVPLAIPMTSGPGAITTAIVLAAAVSGLWQEFFFWAAIFVACAINYAVLRYSDRLFKLAGRHGLEAMTKIMGLMVCSIAIQFVITGLKAAFPVLGG